MSEQMAYATGDHEVAAADPPPPPPPLTPVTPARARSAAEEARTIVAGAGIATLATLSEDGGPWASLVAFAALPDGSPVLLLSHLAEHGRNLQRDSRASLMVAGRTRGRDALAYGRVTLTGRMRTPGPELSGQAREAYLSSVPSAEMYAEFGDFTWYVLEVDRVRWVGGYGRMDSAGAEAYASAEPDPVGDAHAAVTHLNQDHPDALLDIARALGGYPDAESAQCTGADRYGLDLIVMTPRGTAPARIGFSVPVAEAAGLRAATVELTRRARGENGNHADATAH